MKRRFALWLAERLRACAFWLDLHSAPKYAPGMAHLEDVSDEEWETFYATIRGSR